MAKSKTVSKRKKKTGSAATARKSGAASKRKPRTYRKSTTRKATRRKRSPAAQLKRRVGKLSQQLTPTQDAVEHPDHGGHEARVVRKFAHNGRECIIETHYEILIDGEPLSGHLSVDQRGRVHYHGLPNYTFPSAVDLVKCVLDASQHAARDEDELAHIYEDGGSHHGHS